MARLDVFLRIFGFLVKILLDHLPEGRMDSTPD
jgi:hypothetical protein